MAEIIVLDSGPLGRLTHPARNPEIVTWLEHLLDAGVSVVIPEIVDYEVRRSFLLEGLTRSLARLDELGEALAFQPLNTAAMRHAAELWAEARRRGQPTADPKELDGDVILAAQAWQLGATVATENVGHLAQFVPALQWQEITAD